MLKLAPALLVLALFTACAATADDHAKKDKDAGWTDLFNGEDLAGWNNPYEWGEAKKSRGK
ncbi:MAG: hypothetical protein AAF085_14335 [Planctomycetota bacterium]